MMVVYFGDERDDGMLDEEFDCHRDPVHFYVYLYILLYARRESFCNS